MIYVMYIFLLGLILGMVAVASNPSPFFAALGLVVVSGMGCGVLVGHGAPFLSLVLFLIYLGGMLVVFAYSAALAADPYPEGLGSREVAINAGSCVVASLVGGGLFCGLWSKGLWVTADEAEEFSLMRADTGGVALVYSSGGVMLMLTGWVLLLALFVVLEVCRGGSRGALRAI
uniref:NADH-ubiquinone oxidoreductase chain 6 n=3 Tax=Clupeocephala TaxID=186625 RepID=A0A0B4VJ60_9GOBI|nr:NADH dehydrogenase subunit 6 [Acanthogobius flavimanus]AFO37723.1 NADH dehydrogenase subunit 6 [Acanthogobius hasta]QKX65249.1 NADH dehydrogenase subunit 6 [Acanthogobius stigmothonus]UFA49360.1 NADH dehydrogenase subunit 6 [Netuma thalassina]AIL31499.1 NADH dehydrogenase subunit 6 [Acanthogobius hasta]AJD22358.1 NADH dehydrogenase subunit 6 [Acanthogobius hasta]